jgi:hypothetical protein
MTREEKQLLLKDLCARLPYGVRINHIIYDWEGDAINFNKKLESFAIEKDNGLSYDVPVEEVRPYLRPMSSMTEEEENKYNSLNAYEKGIFPHTEEAFDWLLANHFDFRGLIEKSLALSAPKGMYES